MVFYFGVVGGVVDEDVDAAEFGDDGVAGIEQRGFAGDVDHETEAVGSMGGSELLGTKLRVGQAQVEQNHMGAGGCEDGSMLIAEETGSPGNDSDAACEIEEIGGAIICVSHAEISLQGMSRAVINVHCIMGHAGVVETRSKLVVALIKTK